MPTQFFVTVFADSRRELMNLRAYDLDLFQPTAKALSDQEFAIEGLLTLEEIGRLVEGGYRVLVAAEASRRARAQVEVSQFQDWLQAMGAPPPPATDREPEE